MIAELAPAGEARRGLRPPDSAAVDAASAGVARAVLLHALAWLLAGCAAGFVLALLLLAPELGAVLGPFGYGRIAPLHLDLTLYGWLALPWIGALLHAYRADRRPGPARLGLALWSAALAAGALSWLAGRTSGKLFLDWSGPAAWLLLASEVALALVLAPGLLVRDGARTGRSRAGLALLWLVLLSVPPLLAFASSRTAYPAIDPTSGGPTGTSLLGSSLGLVALLLLAPRLLGLHARRGGGALAAGALAFHALAFLALGGGDHSNREPRQIAALASLALWGWILPRELLRFDWPAGCRRWLGAAAIWGAALLVGGVVQFVPPALDRLKFTHALVAHAHLAMAGFASAIAGLLLEARLGASGAASPLSRGGSFALWNGALGLHLAALAVLGGLEAVDPAALLRGGGLVTLLLATRALAGAGMLAAAARWLVEALR